MPKHITLTIEGFATGLVGGRLLPPRGFRGVEVELAFRLCRDLPAREAAYSTEEVAEPQKKGSDVGSCLNYG